MSKNTLRIIKVAVVIFVIATLIGSLIVLQDTHHLETCHEHHCIYCQLMFLGTPSKNRKALKMSICEKLEKV